MAGVKYVLEFETPPPLLQISRSAT